MIRTCTALVLILLVPLMVMAQSGEIRGHLTDASTREALVGATVSLVGTTIGASSDVNGNYVIANIPPGPYTVRVAYVGYITAERRVTVGSELVSLDVALDPTVIQSGEVVVEVNRARERETPVAFTTVDKMAIEQKIHGQDAPLLVMGTPGVFSYSPDGVGNGEGKLFVRGFNQNYVQVLINGVPTNDPESNSVYWSNWGSVSSAAASLQVQRGAGSSLYGAGSFGGSFNIITADAPPKPSYGVNLSLGDPLNSMYGVDLNTGLINNTFAATLRIDRKVAEGSRVSGRYEGVNYYLSGAWYVTPQQSVKLVLHGAPQEHGYTWSNDISYFKKYGYDANPAPFLPHQVVEGLRANATTGQANYGLLDDKRELVDDRFVNLAHNFFHKPQLELHYRYDVTPTSSLNVTGFYSRGRGAGSSLSGNGTTYRLNNDGTVMSFLNDRGYIDNLAVADTLYLKAGAYQRISYSFHQQGGVLANYDFRPLDYLKLTVGGEFRSWTADHPGHFVNLFRNTSITWRYAMRDTAGRVGTQFSRRLRQGDLTGPGDIGNIFSWEMANEPDYGSQYRNYRGETPQYTLFAQGAWAFGKINVITSLQYVHYSYKLIENMPSENAIGQQLTRAQEAGRVLKEGQTGTGTFLMTGTDGRWYEFNLVNATRSRGFWQPKAGINYNVNDNVNVFGNFAHVERFVDLSVYYNQGRLNPKAKDEVSNQFEVGIGWTSPELRAKVNAYTMTWNNKSARIRDVSKSGLEGYDYQGYASILMGKSEHQGIEMEATYDLGSLMQVKGLELQGMLTLMDNKWKEPVDPVDPATGKPREFNGSALGPDGKVDPLYVTEMKNTPVAGGPQTMMMLGLNYRGEEFFGGLQMNYFARQYVLDGGTYMRTGGEFTNGGQLFVSKFGNKLPAYAIVNLNVGYTLPIPGVNSMVSAQVLNLLDKEYLVDADRNGVFPGLGRALRFNLNVGL